MVVITDERFGDFEMVEKFLRLPCVFAGNHTDFFAQDAQGTKGDVFEISNGRRNQVQRGTQAISSVSLNGGSACIRTTLRQEGRHNRRILNGYLHLRQDSSPYAVELNTGLLPRLIAEVSAGARAGKEVGGLLVGSLRRTASVTLRIDDFVVIARRENDEARYSLTPEQRARLSTTRRELLEGRTAVLGFFRSHMRREGLALSGDDRKLLTVEFGKAIYVALLIRAQAPHIAGFVIPNAEGALPPGSVPKELQFDAEEAGQRRQQAALQVSPSTAHLAPATAERETPPDQPGRSGILALTRRKTALSSVWAASVMLMALLLTAWAPFTTHLFGASRGGLRLKATPRGNMLEIQWNRRQPDVERAGGAILTIEDGSSRELKLTPFELRTGKLSYQRKGNRITVRMRVELPESAELVQSAQWPAR